MLDRFHAVDLWLTWVYDEHNDRKAAHAFANKLLKCADPRVRRVMLMTLSWDKQSAAHARFCCRN